MEEKTPDLNKEIINVKELSEKLTEDVKKNVLRLEVGDGVGCGFFCKINIHNIIIPVLITCNHVLNEDYIKKKIFHSFFSVIILLKEILKQ